MPTPLSRTITEDQPGAYVLSEDGERAYAVDLATEKLTPISWAAFRATPKDARFCCVRHAKLARRCDDCQGQATIFLPYDEALCHECSARRGELVELYDQKAARLENFGPVRL